jgi:hypothetical protein
MHAELALWVGAFLCFLAAEIALVFRRELLKLFFVAAAIGLITVWLVLAKPLLWICALGRLTAWALFAGQFIGKKKKLFRLIPLIPTL